MSRLNDLDGLQWLVEARNAIQRLMLDLHELQKRGLDGTPEQRTAWRSRWQWADGAVFSLWRAVFLIDTTGDGRRIEDVMESGALFLQRVIETNAVSFSDDRAHRHWTSGYYVNNAAFRIAQIQGREFDASDRLLSLRDRWNRYFDELSEAVASGLPGSEQPKGRA